MPLLGNADPGATSDTSILLILGALAVLGGTVDIWRGCRWLRCGGGGCGWPVGGGFLVGESVWGYAAASLGLGTLFAICRSGRAREQRAGCRRGYYDASNAPVFAWHWGGWGVQAAVYVGLLAAAFGGKRRF